jgi:putative transposase
MAELFCETLFRYRNAQKFRVHSFVVMPNHFHLILTVAEGLALERAMQLIKGGFSHEAGRRLGGTLRDLAKELCGSAGARLC